MLIFTELSYKPLTEINRIEKELNLTEDEEKVFDMAVKTDKTAQEMAFEMHKSVRSIFYIMNRVRKKIMIYYNS